MGNTPRNERVPPVGHPFAPPPYLFPVGLDSQLQERRDSVRLSLTAKHEGQVVKQLRWADRLSRVIDREDKT